MGWFSFRKAKKKYSADEIKQRCRNGTLKERDIEDFRIINLVGIAQELIDEGDDESAEKLISLSLNGNPNVVIGHFLLSHDNINPKGMEQFKYMLDTKEERNIFYRLCQSGRITVDEISGNDSETEKMMAIAFHEGEGMEENEEDEYANIPDEEYAYIDSIEI